MTLRAPVLLTVTLATAWCVPAIAHALDQSKHRAVSRDACADADLPWNFCERVGIEAYNVDHFEWHDMAAHAQVDAGQSQCEAANLAADRVGTLGTELRDGIAGFATSKLGVDSQTLAIALGRALHTIQDNCAHRGVSNPHHAWLSHDDTCLGTKRSPDARPEALACAEAETAAVVAAFASAVRDAGIALRNLDDQGDRPMEITRWPSRGDVCEFLASGGSWDGVDDHWNDGIVVPAVRERFVAGLGGASASADVCGGDPQALATAADPAIDTSAGQAACKSIQAFCFGKDDAPDALPPWQDPAEAAADNAGDDAQGCAIGDARAPSLGAFVAIVLLGGRGRRRVTHPA